MEVGRNAGCGATEVSKGFTCLAAGAKRSGKTLGRLHVVYSQLHLSRLPGCQLTEARFNHVCDIRRSADNGTGAPTGVGLGFSKSGPGPFTITALGEGVSSFNSFYTPASCMHVHHVG